MTTDFPYNLIRLFNSVDKEKNHLRDCRCILAQTNEYTFQNIQSYINEGLYFIIKNRRVKQVGRNFDHNKDRSQ